MASNHIESMLESWDQQMVHHYLTVNQQIPIAIEDTIKLDALAEAYQLPREKIITHLISHALKDVEEKIPYIPGSKVIRTEEGDPVYEDIGHTPKYLSIKTRLEKQRSSHK